MTLFDMGVDRDAEAAMAAIAGPPRYGSTARLVEWALTTSADRQVTAEEVHERIGRRRSLSSVRVILDGLTRVADPAGRLAVSVGKRGRSKVYRPAEGWNPPHSGIFATKWSRIAAPSSSDDTGTGE